jgi:hypothetical protein
MSLLDSALRAREGPGGDPTPSSALAEAVKGRRDLDGRAGDTEPVAPADALSVQLAYDVALIRYARCLGIACQPSDFDPPSRGRAHVEREISERGFELA